VTRQSPAKSARQELEPIAEAVRELAHAENFSLGGSQLESKRHSVEAPADLGRERRVTVGQHKPANGLGDPFDEQFNRGKGECLPRRHARVRLGTSEW